MLKKDNWTLGILLGLFLPVIMYGLIYGIMLILGRTPAGSFVLRDSTMMLLALFSNMLSFRYYMVKLKYDRTGRGILLITFAYAFVFFYLFM